MCLNCRRVLDGPSFPLGRPRRDGTRSAMRYCLDCWRRTAGSGLAEGGRDAALRARRSWRVRAQAVAL